jgi:(2Fe-2S) ferredoxin
MNHVNKIALIFFTVLIVSCSSISPSIDEDTLVKIETSGCYGECPIFIVIVKKNGELTYEGLKHVHVKGIKSAVLSKEAVSSIEAELVESKFFKMQSKLHSGSWNCFVSATDHSYILIEASIKNRKKAVSTYTGCDSEQVNKIIDLATYIGKVTEISRWVNQNP